MDHAFYLFNRCQKHKDMAESLFSVDVDNSLEYLQEIVFGWLSKVVYQDWVLSSSDVHSFNF
jgi:hypothetical protein